ncbi:carbohydrate kinase family protein [Alloacidobacterium sp.]|uniref:carbohydrate kinase family protein n=1 Tax=Alloacidobacterium sp. TaxID=2951999 RepID=UPI002D58ACDA|nr:carbohydrate kinase family protein [Alloacidobacterium sp.]HYK36705.1 carbohydrate kinase family protein [Alloacidobacterium sp.]
MKDFDIAIAGELNLDVILYGLPTEMPTERELLASSFGATLGGSSSIVAHNAATLGAGVAFTSLIGNDEFGRIALDRLVAAGVDVSTVVRHSDAASGITVILPHGDQRHMLTFAGTIADLTIAHLDFDFLARARHLHLSSLYLQRGLHAGLPEFLRRLKRAGLTISLDTNDDPEDRWGDPLPEVLIHVDVFLPNEDEICRMTGRRGLNDAVQALPVKPPVIAVKRGRHGARVYEHGSGIDVAPLVVTPVDTIGAGDSFDAGFLCAYLLSKDAVTCARAGNITGALSTQSAGGTEAFRDQALRETFLGEHRFFDLLGGGNADIRA